jgi:hypothetical protein
MLVMRITIITAMIMHTMTTLVTGILKRCTHS